MLNSPQEGQHRLDKIIKYVKDNPHPKNPDYALYTTGEIIKGKYLTLLVVGFEDNKSACEEIAIAWTKEMLEIDGYKIEYYYCEEI